MPYTIETLDTPVPAVLTRISGTLDVDTDLPRMLSDLNDRLTGFEGDVVYNIIDATGMALNFSSVVTGLAATFQPGYAAHLPQLFAPRVTPVMIGNGALLMLLVKSLQQDQYGRHRMQMFTTVDEALAHITQTHAVNGA